MTTFGSGAEGGIPLYDNCIRDNIIGWQTFVTTTHGDNNSDIQVLEQHRDTCSALFLSSLSHSGYISRAGPGLLGPSD